ncbi:MAG: 50S ribosomal protein L5 [Candidatus Omnitrophica bacterium]|nr:50S ribosomal protein L5 [Candidatus Omnitrophota bacterium]
MPRLQKKYQEQCLPKMKEKFHITNDMAVPRLEKIAINMGVGKSIADIKILDAAVKDLESITGQKVVMTRAKKAISNFKLRIGLPIGCRVTLRRARMYEFLDRLISIALPRIRDFNGISRHSFDKQGNYTLGITDQTIFPEIDTGKLQNIQGMDITIVFNQGNPEQTFELLSLLGMPFTKK